MDVDTLLKAKEIKNSLEPVEWDSNFFNFKVGRIVPNLDFEELKKNLFLASKEGVNLIYYSSSYPLLSTKQISPFYDAKLVDKKITYIKNAEANSDYLKFISTYKKHYPENKLIQLAIESGIYSRFNIDSKIGRQKFEELYKLWIINSVNKKIAKEIFTYTENEEILGFVTLGMKGSRGDIGIIAVESLHRGKGIGKSLMVAAESWFANNFYNVIQVVTQGENIPACRLYESCRFEVEKIEYLYHFWKS